MKQNQTYGVTHLENKIFCSSYKLLKIITYYIYIYKNNSFYTSLQFTIYTIFFYVPIKEIKIDFVYIYNLYIYKKKSIGKSFVQESF